MCPTEPHVPGYVQPGLCNALLSVGKKLLYKIYVFTKNTADLSSSIWLFNLIHHISNYEPNEVHFKAVINKEKYSKGGSVLDITMVKDVRSCVLRTFFEEIFYFKILHHISFLLVNLGLKMPIKLYVIKQEARGPYRSPENQFQSINTFAHDKTRPQRWLKEKKDIIFSLKTDCPYSFKVKFPSPKDVKFGWNWASGS